MHLQPPLPNSSEPPRQPRITQRLWDDWSDGDGEDHETLQMATVQAGAFHTDATEEHPLGVGLTRPFSWLDAWADDQETLIHNAVRVSSPLSGRPFGARRSMPYAPPVPGLMSGRLVLLIAALATGMLLLGGGLAFGLGFLSFPSPSGDAGSTGAGGATPPTATLVPTATTTATALPAIAAQFVSQDTALQGSWQPQYGSKGYVVVGDTQQLPPGVQVTPANQQEVVWQPSTSDPRALQKATNPTDHIAACWYASSSFALDVNISDGQTYQLALYVLDWDQQQRAETITLLDPTTQTLLDARSITAFTNGAYLVWNVRGHITVQITAIPGTVNAVVSGVFLAPVATTPGAEPTATAGASATDTPTPTQPSSSNATPSAVPTETPTP